MMSAHRKFGVTLSPAPITLAALRKRAGKSSTNRQLIPLNRKPGGQIYRQSIDKNQESIDGEEDNTPE